MQAAVYRGIDDIRVEEVPVPDIGPGEALVRIRACGVCGTDLKKIHHGLVPPPSIFGHEMAGDIVRLGEGLDHWRVGDRVAVMHHVPCLHCHFCRANAFAQCPIYKKTGTTAGFEPAGGGFAQYIRVMDWVVERGMVRIPESVSYESAAFIEPLNTCLKAVEKAEVLPGQAIIVLGQGPIGLLFTRIISLSGAAAYTTDLLDWRRRESRTYGAVESWDPLEADVRQSIREVTEARGADAVILTVPESREIPAAIEMARPGGKVVIFAQTRPGDMVSLDAGAICMAEKDLIGSYSSDITLQDRSAQMIFDGSIDVTPLITHRFPLDRIAEAVALASDPRESSLKIMIEP